MEVDRTEVGGPLWKSCRSSWKFAILLEAGEGYLGVYRPSWMLPRNIFVAAAIDGSNAAVFLVLICSCGQGSTR